MKKLFSLVAYLFLSTFSLSASMEEWDGSKQGAVKLGLREKGNALETQPKGEDIPEGFNPMTASPLRP